MGMQWMGKFVTERIVLKKKNWIQDMNWRQNLEVKGSLKCLKKRKGCMNERRIEWMLKNKIRELKKGRIYE